MDYKKNGIVYCGECDTPKQSVIKIKGRDVLVGCLCKCQQEKAKKSEIEMLNAEFKQKVKRLRKTAFQDTKLLNWTLENDDMKNAKLSTTAKRYVQNFDKINKGLIIFGDVGTGKTFMAAAMANALIDKGYSCKMTNFVEIANEIFSIQEKADYINNLAKKRLVVLDDYSTERKTEYMYELTYSVIDKLYTCNTPTIITTNLTPEELQKKGDVQDKIKSRIMEMCIPVKVQGKDRRQEKLIKNYQENKEILGL